MFTFATTDAIYAAESSAHWLVQRFDAPHWFTIGVDLTEAEARRVLDRIVTREKRIPANLSTQFRVINKYEAELPN